MDRFLDAPRPEIRLSRRTLTVAGIAAITAAAAGAAIPARFIGRVYPGTVVLGQDVSGMTSAEAIAHLQQSVAATTSALVTFRLDDQEWIATAADLGVTIDWDRLSAGIMGRGRESADARLGALLPWSGAETVSLPVALDNATLTAYLSTIDETIAVEPADATLAGSGPDISIVPDVAGRHVDLGRAREVVTTAASTLVAQVTDLPLIVIEADITAAQLAATKDRVIRLTEEPITLAAGESSWTLAPADLAGGLVMPDDVLTDDPWLDPWWISQLVDPVVTALWQPATDATIAWDGGLYATSDSKTGRMVDRDALVQRVIDAAGSAEREITVDVESVAPRIDHRKLDDLGITGLLTSGDSSFAGSSDARLTNVGVAAQWVSQATIAPGEQFSFNDALGPITEDRGYVTGKVITGDWITDDIGGGVCQVSTTVYRAALYAGLHFDEWHPHSSRVTFYEQDGWPIGVDASIYQIDPAEGWPLDLTFTNTTDSWLLLQMINGGTTIYAQLYGAPMGWSVEIPDPLVGPPIPAPAPQTRPTTELPAGQTLVVQQAQEGVDVELYRTVTTRDGTLIEDNVFKSYYQPMPQVTEVGAGSSSAPSAPAG